MTHDELLAVAKEAGLWLAPFDTSERREMVDAWSRFAALIEARAAQEEREACAEMCDDMVLYTGYDCAAAIRARGGKP